MEKIISKFKGIKLNSNKTFKSWKIKIKKIPWNKLS